MYGTNPVLYQENQSAMKLARNGHASSGKRTKHINIQYFFITDRIKAKEVTIEYCPTKSMDMDFFMEPLQGVLFRKFRDQILGLAPMGAIQGGHRGMFDYERKLEKEQQTDDRRRQNNSGHGHYITNGIDETQIEIW